MTLQLVIDRPAKHQRIASLQDCTVESPNCDRVAETGLLDSCECIDRWWYYGDLIQVVGAQAYVMEDSGVYTQDQGLHLANQFWKRVDRNLDDDSACWPWKGKFDRVNGARFRTFDQEHVEACRWALTWTFCDDPDRAVVQICKNRLCVRPEHLAYGKEMVMTEEAAKTARGRGRPRKLTPETVEEIRRLLTEKTLTQAEIAEKFGVTQGLVSNVKRNVGAYAVKDG